MVPSSLPPLVLTPGTFSQASPIPAGLSRWIFPLCASAVPVPAVMPPWLGALVAQEGSPRGCQGGAGSWEYPGTKINFSPASNLNFLR